MFAGFICAISFRPRGTAPFGEREPHRQRAGRGVERKGVAVRAAERFELPLEKAQRRWAALHELRGDGKAAVGKIGRRARVMPSTRSKRAMPLSSAVSTNWFERGVSSACQSASNSGCSAVSAICRSSKIGCKTGGSRSRSLRRMGSPSPEFRRRRASGCPPRRSICVRRVQHAVEVQKPRFDLAHAHGERLAAAHAAARPKKYASSASSARGSTSASDQSPERVSAVETATGLAFAPVRSPHGQSARGPRRRPAAQAGRARPAPPLQREASGAPNAASVKITFTVPGRSRPAAPLRRPRPPSRRPSRGNRLRCRRTPVPRAIR